MRCRIKLPSLQSVRLSTSTYTALSTQFTGFSICHPMYDNKHMLKVVQHATASALNNQEATATFLQLSNWMENSTNALHKTCTDDKDVCTILGYIPKKKVCYMPLFYQQSKTPPLPEATWNIRVLVVWNKAAREQFVYKNNPSWLRRNKTRPITSGNLEFKKCRHHNFS